MPGPLRLLLVAAASTLVVVLVGTFVRSPAPAAPQEPAATPLPRLSRLDTLSLTGRRAPFCADIDPAAVVAAIGTGTITASDYANGERTALTDTITDVAHEFGCTWQTADGARVRAWVFAPPVTPSMAGDLEQEARDEPGCDRLTDAASFGRSSAGLMCRTPRGPTASYRGLLGDAWVTCALVLPDRPDRREETATRIGPWCAAVAVAVSGS